MGVTPQTIENGLKPYGLIYDLLRNYKVPVYWIINPAKVKDGVDFTFDGIQYRSSAFIVDKSFINPTIQAAISSWNAKGVIGAYTLHDTTFLPYEVISSWPRVVMDLQNGFISAAYYANAEITQTDPNVYIIGSPADLNSCHDVYIMPHADPIWSTHQNLYPFITTNKGYLWAACHAVSVMEELRDPTNTIQLNFLSTRGLQCYNTGGCGLFSTERHKNQPTLPITFNSTMGADPIAQFIDDVTPALLANGSEKWFIPNTGSTWNSNTKKIIRTGDGSAPAEGLQLVYGKAYNNSNYGLVSYTGAHDHNGTLISNVGIMRTFFNFILKTGIDKRPQVTISGITKDTVIHGNTKPLTASVTTGTAPYTYQWSSNCGVIFSNPTDQTTNATFPIIPTGSTSNCVVWVTVSDACGRTNFNYDILTISTAWVLANTSTDFKASVTSNQRVKAAWTAAKPNNIKSFVVERSKNGFDFEQVGVLDAGSSDNFSFIDMNAPAGKLHYRLASVTNDLRKTYSQTEVVLINKSEVYIFPTPAATELTMANLPAGESILILRNSSGQELLKKKVVTAPGESLKLNIQSYAPGLYFLEMKHNGGNKVFRVVH
jgi:hypothetical protein